MSKQFLEDMIEAKRARPDNLDGFRPSPKESREIRKKTEEKIFNNFEIETNHPSRKNKSRFLLWFVALFSVIFCFFAVSLLFAKATVLVNPKIINLTLNENLSATKDSNANGPSFDLVVIPGQESKTIPATGQKNVSESATGTVVIFNTFSSASQIFSVETRLEGSNGEIYKTQTKTVVPGMNKDGTPGQVEVGIYAAAAGQTYNSSTPLDFTIIGFKGTPKYSKFVVRSKPGTEITGGFVGEAPDISPADEATVESVLKTTLQTDLLAKATAQIPDGYILFKDAVFLNTDDSDLSSVYNPDNTATITLTGTLDGVILSEQELTQKIATDNIQSYDDSDVYIPDIKNLVFSLVPAADTSLANAQNINFSLTGPAQIVWKVDTDKFISDLLGKSKKDFSQILSQYTNIDSATLTITPIWKMSIPDQTKNVKVIVNYPQ